MLLDVSSIIFEKELNKMYKPREKHKYVQRVQKLKIFIQNLIKYMKI